MQSGQGGPAQSGRWWPGGGPASDGHSMDTGPEEGGLCGTYLSEVQIQTYKVKPKLVFSIMIRVGI